MTNIWTTFVTKQPPLGVHNAQKTSIEPYPVNFGQSCQMCAIFDTIHLSFATCHLDRNNYTSSNNLTNVQVHTQYIFDTYVHTSISSNQKIVQAREAYKISKEFYTFPWDIAHPQITQHPYHLCYDGVTHREFVSRKIGRNSTLYNIPCCHLVLSLLFHIQNSVN